ncbi:MAG TPA: hypothetical protein VGH79_02710 [Gaiellaceae bacterium]|jgi:hypothetical protein
MAFPHEMVADVAPNVLTRVPPEPVPELPAWGAAVIPAADLFMVLLLSRPETGSLRSTWVTPATLVLGATTGLASIACLVLVIADLSGLLRVVAALGLAFFAAGSLCLAVVGLAQRAARRTA